MSSPILDYGPPPPWRKRRSVRRAAILIALAVLVLSAPWWAAPIYRHAKVLYWQRQCMNYKMPVGGIPAGTVPKEWERFSEAANVRLGSSGTLFIGTVNRADGIARLVVVDLSSVAFSYPFGERVTPIFTVIDPGSLLRSPRFVEQDVTPFPPVSKSLLRSGDGTHILMQDDQGSRYTVWVTPEDQIYIRKEIK